MWFLNITKGRSICAYVRKNIPETQRFSSLHTYPPSDTHTDTRTIKKQKILKVKVQGEFPSCSRQHANKLKLKNERGETLLRWGLPLEFPPFPSLLTYSVIQKQIGSAHTQEWGVTVSEHGDGGHEDPLILSVAAVNPLVPLIQVSPTQKIHTSTEVRNLTIYIKSGMDEAPGVATDSRALTHVR